MSAPAVGVSHLFFPFLVVFSVFPSAWSSSTAWSVVCCLHTVPPVRTVVPVLAAVTGGPRGAWHVALVADHFSRISGCLGYWDLTPPAVWMACRRQLLVEAEQLGLLWVLLAVLITTGWCSPCGTAFFLSRAAAATARVHG